MHQDQEPEADDRDEMLTLATGRRARPGWARLRPPSAPGEEGPGIGSPRSARHVGPPAPPAPAGARDGERLRDDVRDAQEGQAAREERRNGDLVRRIEGARARAAPLPRLARQGEQGERGQIGCPELECEAACEVEPRHGRGAPLGVREREGDRDAHVGVARVRERGAVAETHERVHDRGWVDDDFDPVVREPEEHMRLDQLEPLVGERRRVHGDLRTHAPGGMRQRLCRRHVRELVSRAATNGPPDAVSTSESTVSRARPSRHWNTALCSLSTGSSPPRAAGRPARAHRRRRGSLVCQRERDAPLERSQGRPTPAKPTTALRTTSGCCVEQARQLAAHLDVLDAVRRGDRREVMRARRDGEELEPGIGCDDLECLATDRAGRSE